MRILLATDGSTCSSTAVDLVAGLTWPDDVTVDVVSVYGPTYAPWAFAPVPDLNTYYAELDTDALNVVNAAVTRLREHGLQARGVVLRGREAPTIVERAFATDASLIVCGSRGRGYLHSVLLGSVSAEVAATATCSVLVARHPTVSGVVLAVDGSGPAAAAEHLVERLPMFAHIRLDLVAVTGQPIGPEDEWQAHVRQVADTQRDVEARLIHSGRDPNDVLLTGDPARGIVDQAQRSRADLIVLGAHAQTGLDRLLLGSTTLEVLTHSQASVLVAREPVSRVRSGDSARAVPREWTEPQFVGSQR